MHMQRENIVSYLEAGKRAGLRETDCFVTGDLYEASNMGQGQLRMPSSAQPSRAEPSRAEHEQPPRATATTVTAASTRARLPLTQLTLPIIIACLICLPPCS